MNICTELCSSGWSAILRGKNFSIGHRTQTFQQNFVRLAMHMGTTDFYYFIPLSKTYTLAEGHKISTKTKLTDFTFSHTFRLVRMKFTMVQKQLKLNILVLFLSQIWSNKRISVVLLTASKNFNTSLHSDVYESVWFKVDLVLDTIVVKFDTSIIDLDFDSWSQQTKKSSISVSVISQRFQ